MITVDRSGRASITETGEPVRTATLTAGQQDTLRLLTPLLNAGPVPPCDSTEYYRVRFDDGPVRPDCSFRGRYPEFRALVGLLEDVFEQ